MSLFRTVVGGVCGFVVGGPLGAIVGASIGYQLSDNTPRLDTEAGSSTQMAFFVATFSVMGHIAKINGRVHPEAINYAKYLMNEMQLDNHLQATAINLFRQGKKADFQLDPVLSKFYHECHARPDLIQRFVTIQLHTAIADGVLSNCEDALLWQICARLKLSRFFYERSKIQLLSQHYFYQQKSNLSQARPKSSLAEAYQVLGLTPSATASEVKNAYRRLMSQHHPDKLATKGLSEDAMNRAKEKTQQISKAYDTIQKATKFER